MLNYTFTSYHHTEEKHKLTAIKIVYHEWPPYNVGKSRRHCMQEMNFRNYEHITCTKTSMIIIGHLHGTNQGMVCPKSCCIEPPISKRKRPAMLHNINSSENTSPYCNRWEWVKHAWEYISIDLHGRLVCARVH